MPRDATTKLRRQQFGLWLFVVGVTATVVLGVVGNHQDAVQKGKAPASMLAGSGGAAPPQAPAAPGEAPSQEVTWGRYVADILYRTVQLFILQLNPWSYPVPPVLELARWLGAIVAGVALFKAAAEIFRQQLDERKLRLLKHHVIVCGLGQKGFHLVRQLHQRGDKVVVIEIDEGDDSLATCRAMGVPVLVGDATSEHMLREAGARRAARLIAVCREDSVNIEIALQARHVVNALKRDAASPLVCHVHIIDLKLAELFRQHKIFSCTSDPFEARIFSFYENSARELLMRHPLDAAMTKVSSGQPPRAAPPQCIHLVIVGLGQMGESIALQAARIGHFATRRRLRVTAIDPLADERKLSLLSRYPQLDKVVELEFLSQSVEHPAIRDRLMDWAISAEERMIVAICVDDDPQALSIALNLPRAIRDAGVPVCVRQSEQRGLASLIDDRLQDRATGWDVTSFGAPEVSAGIEQILQEKLDKLALAIHEHYIQQRHRDGSARPNDPAMEPWQRLEAGLKSSNRQQADHIDIKLRAIGCRRIGKAESLPAGAEEFERFEPPEIELLTRMEHDRWCADRLLSGWQLGPSDKPRKISPYLIPYEELEDRIQQYDREAVLQIPDLVAQAGDRIVRIRVSPSGPLGPAMP